MDRYVIDDRYRKMIDGSMDFQLVKVFGNSDYYK